MKKNSAKFAAYQMNFLFKVVSIWTYQITKSQEQNV